MILTNTEISRALNELRPNSQWALTENDYANIQWMDKDSSLPSLSEIETKVLELRAYDDAAPQRKAEAQAKRQALLDKLGITEDEARLLLGGN